MKKILYFAAVLFGLSIISCEKEPDPVPVPVTGITIDITSLALTEGETAILSASVVPDNADNKGISWSSSDESVASVSDGMVTALAPGSATITAMSDDGGKTATCSVTVSARVISVTGVSLDKTEVVLAEGDEITLTATVTPDDAANKNVVWSSDNEDVASVKDGMVTANKPGSAIITVKTEDGGFTATCAVSVPGISIKDDVYGIVEGETLQLEFDFFPSDMDVLWTSSDEDIATVSSSGLVTAKTKGDVLITAATLDGQHSDSCRINVREITSQIRLSCYSLDISGGYVNGDYLGPGVRISWAISNQSHTIVKVVGLSVLDGLSRTPVIYTIEPSFLDPGLGKYYTVTLEAEMYMPIVQFTFEANGKRYKVEYQYDGSVGGWYPAVPV